MREDKWNTMKVVLYHISDLHIEKSQDIKVSNVKKMIDVLNGLQPFDKIILIISGDIAQAGKHDQYNIAFKMFGTIIKEIKDNFCLKWIDILLVPGNHDVDLELDDEGHAGIQNKIRKGISQDMIDNELEKQKNYLNYAKGNHCLDEADKLCFIKTIFCGQKKIKICMLNTALFSTLDGDKGLHFMPEYVLEKMCKELNGDVNITVLHHAHHWMHDSIKNKFENILFQYNNVILCGHEHDIESREIKKNGWKVVYLTGGELSNRGDWSKSEFYINVIDTDRMSMNSIQYKWNEKRQVYNKQKEQVYSLKNMNSKFGFELEEEFNKWLYSDQVNTISDSIFDYYVFPDLERIKETSNAENKVIGDEESFVDLIIDKKRVAIVGTEGSGKTSLLKKLFIEFTNNGYFCLYCNASLLEKLSLKKILLTVFRNNYIDLNGSFDEYIQLPKEKKIFLLDDINDIDKSQVLSLLDYLKGIFGIIVYSTKELIEFDITERMKQSVDLEDYSRFRLMPMYLKKRKLLITKVGKQLDDSLTEETSENIAKLLKQQRKFYSMNPSFVIQFTDLYLKNFKDAFATD